jgi:hypothetical protein
LRSKGEEGKCVKEEDFGGLLTPEDDTGRHVGLGSAEEDKREGDDAHDALRVCFASLEIGALTLFDTLLQPICEIPQFQASSHLSAQ